MSTIAEVSRKLKRLEELPDTVVDIMKKEVPVGLTGKLKAGVHKESVEDEVWSVKSDVFYDKFVEYGRGPVKVKPDRLKANPRARLSWFGYAGQQTSIHKPGDPGTVHFALEVGPADPNDYIGRTAKKGRAWVRQLFS